LALEQAQKFSKESIYYVTACVLILITMIFAGVTSAQLWSEANKKRIFTLHTFGRAYASIIKPALNKELTIAVIAIIVGSIVTFKVRYPEPVALLLAAWKFILSVALLYGLGSLFAYRMCTRQTFHQISHRYY
jgi:predicted lysophospholipase L1 biosynthesis ABC-type transport system permease subunit